MLKLQIAMLRINEAFFLRIFAPILAFSLLFLAAPAGMTFAQTPVPPEPQLSIDSPRAGEALQGMISIHGSLPAADFRSAEVAFGYQSDPTNTWFLIQQVSSPAAAGVLAGWDTTTISDGMYRLRLQVLLKDGKVVEQTVNGLRVRNYTAVEPSTPEPPAAENQPAVTSPAEAPTASPTPLRDFQVGRVSPTPLPTNPAQLTQRDLQASALQGMAVVLSALAVAGVYLGLRGLTRR